MVRLVMTNSYLVIVSAEGLELLTEESTHARRFLIHRCFGRQRGREACYWAHLATENAELIHWLIQCGQQRPALWLLNQSARDAGLLAPASVNFLDETGIFFAH